MLLLKETLLCLLLLLVAGIVRAQERKRAREYGMKIGVLNTGKNNAITDVPGVRVGQVTVKRGENIRTGVTAIDNVSPLFLATIEATEEAIINSLFKAETISGNQQHQVPALPIDKTLKILNKHHAR